MVMPLNSQQDLAVVNTPSDGHCLLHAVNLSWQNQVEQSPPPCLHSLKCLVFEESLKNRDLYLSFIPSSHSISDYTRQLRDYIINGKYNSAYGDLVPAILANSLSLALVIKDIQTDFTSQDVHIRPFHAQPVHSIVIQRQCEHYSGLVQRPADTNKPSISLDDDVVQPSNFPPTGDTRPITKNKPVICYSADALRALRSPPCPVQRKVRKRLFACNLWKPKISNAISDVRILENDGGETACDSHILVVTTNRQHGPRKRPQDAIDNSVLKSIPKGIISFKRRNFVKLAMVNACSLRNKYLDFMDFVSESDYDLCFVTETWLKPKDRNIIAALKGEMFDFISSHRKGRTGGGIGLIFKRNYKVVMANTIELRSFELAEFKVSTDDESISVICIYRPPYSANHPVTFSSFMVDFEYYLHKIVTDNRDFIILGDFNIHVNDPDCRDAKNFADLLSANGLKQHVAGATHKSGNTLDLIVTPEASRVALSPPSIDYFFSDHAFVSSYISIVKAKVTRKTVSYRNIKSIDEVSFLSDLSVICDALMSAHGDVTEEYNEQLSSLLNRHAPLITKRISSRGYNPWFDKTALTMKRDKRKLERSWLKSKTAMKYDNFQIARQIYREYISEKKSEYLNNKIRECGRDSGRLYKEVFALLDLVKENPLPSDSSDDNLADKFSSFFSDKVDGIRQELAHHQPYMPHCSVGPQFRRFTPLSVKTVSGLIMKSKSSTCPTDPLPTWLIKKHCDITAPVVTKIINNSLTSGSFHDCWKTSVVRPLIKKPGAGTALSNYRPVSNLPFISKIAEKSALHQFVPYIDSHKLIPDYQSAYRKHFSTETAVLKLVNDVLWAMESQEVTSFLAIDLSAAFDTVDHHILLNVLNSGFRVTGSALNWFNSYLSTRKFYVKINEATSKPNRVECSVPQGSVAGPVLFTAYSSTLASSLKDSNVNIMGYADDHALYKSFTTSNENDNLKSLVSSMASVKSWMNSNKLKMNDSKTEFVYFGSRQQLLKCHTESIEIDQCNVERTKSVKYLGAVLDQHLSFQDHIKQKCKIAALNIQYIGSIRKHLSQESANQLALSMVLSHLDYCNSVLAGLPASTIKKAQNIQNWAAKVVLKRNRYDSSTRALYDLHWLPVQYRINYKIAVMVFKCLNNMAPSYLQDLLVIKSHPRRTRASGSSSLIIPFTKCSTFAHRSFSVQGPSIWNSLPSDVKLSDNLNIFRKNLKTFLFYKAFSVCN